ncbi:hypothetical protein BO71DRAFT_482141 [Aspergillus ellipticus CBS 707.79]|uniref:Uncharacterized protein n=1 Tax=Aspergillus ellipticus CBS 707.79 TaxID=1448320 RepID=A0A319EXH7_9EURO|nr:hypothetical protein BO71DRAFT_482141 [Aspergillus ellipticus CBS 707.79]
MRASRRKPRPPRSSAFAPTKTDRIPRWASATGLCSVGTLRFFALSRLGCWHSHRIRHKLWQQNVPSSVIWPCHAMMYLHPGVALVNNPRPRIRNGQTKGNDMQPRPPPG